MIDLPIPVVLASSSTTRRALLAGLVASFEVVAPEVYEADFDAPAPRELALGLAQAKAREVAGRNPGALVIAADTMVVCGDEIIGKPADLADGRRILRLLASSPHKVVTGLVALTPDGTEQSCYVETGVWLKPMSDGQIADYMAVPGIMDRAGAYALEPDDPLLDRIDGSMTCVMGLPMEALEKMLTSLYPDAARDG